MKLIDKDSWKEYRKMRIILLGISVILDMLVWELLVPGYSLSWKTGHNVANIATDFCSFILDSTIAVMAAFFFSEVSKSIFGEKLYEFKYILLQRGFLLIGCLVTCWLLSLVYLALGWENVVDSTLTTLSCTMIALFNASIYYTFTHQKEIRGADKKMAGFRSRLITDNHFMMNNLCQLKGLIRKNPEQAELMIDALSDCHRYASKNINASYCTLKEEIGMLEAYLKVMEYRFPDAFDFQIDKEVYERNGYLPAMCLQVGAENVFKHNIVSRKHPIHIHLTIVENTLVMTNDLIKLVGEIPTSRIGLKIMQEFYDRYELKLETIKSNGMFILKLPIIQSL